MNIGKFPQFVIGCLLTIIIYIVSIMYFQISPYSYGMIGFWGMIISCGIGFVSDTLFFGIALGFAVWLVLV